MAAYIVEPDNGYTRPVSLFCLHRQRGEGNLTAFRFKRKRRKEDGSILCVPRCIPVKDIFMANLDSSSEVDMEEREELLQQLNEIDIKICILIDKRRELYRKIKRMGGVYDRDIPIADDKV